RELARAQLREAGQTIGSWLASKLEISPAPNHDQLAVFERGFQRSDGEEDRSEHEARQRSNDIRESEHERHDADGRERQSGTKRPRQVEPIATRDVCVEALEVHRTDAREACLRAA